MLFMMVSTLSAMVLKLRDFWDAGLTLLLVVGGCITLTGIWLVVEAVLAVRRFRREARTEQLDIPVN